MHVSYWSFNNVEDLTLQLYNLLIKLPNEKLSEAKMKRGILSTTFMLKLFWNEAKKKLKSGLESSYLKMIKHTAKFH